MKPLLIAITILFFNQAYCFEIQQNKRVDFWVKEYSENRRTHFQNSLNRSRIYLPIVKQIFEKEGLPVELAWLPIVESGYDCSSTSRVDAAGCWQFMKETGVEYGVNKDFWKDNRYDFYKSTQAAADYLKWLYSKFGDLNLSLAAYNCGLTKIRRSAEKDFWKMDLPKETMDYIPKFYAVLIIINDLEKYGFKSYKDNGLKTVVLTKGPHNLKLIGRMLNVDQGYFLRINPGYELGFTPPGEQAIIYLRNEWDDSVLRAFGLVKKKALRVN